MRNGQILRDPHHGGPEGDQPRRPAPAPPSPPGGPFRRRLVRRFRAGPARTRAAGRAGADGGGETLSLKARLERLVAVATLKERERRSAPVPVPLEELVAGMRIWNERGEFFLVESSVHLEQRRGNIPFSRVHAIDPCTVGVLTGEPALDGFDLRGAVFLDTETTGLAGGTGTDAFLIGVGWVEGSVPGPPVLHADYHEEAAHWPKSPRGAWAATGLVTFNGRTFDMPLLGVRYRIIASTLAAGGGDTPGPAADRTPDWSAPARIVTPSRRSRPRCMGLRRHGDIPGEEIPQVYFDWVRRRDARMLARVFEHNRQDIVSLAALAVLACQWVEEGRAEDPRDVFSLARVLERARLYERSEAEYRRALDLGPGALRGPALLRLAWRAKRAGEHDRAAALWAEAGEAGEVEGWRELAMHHEHRARDLDRALAAVERGMRMVEPERDRDVRAWHLAEGFERRQQRLLRKRAKQRI